MRYALVLIGAITTLIITLALLGIPIAQLLLGGALTSVFVGIAAQQSLSNVFAGIVLMLAHPFRVGDSIRMQAGALGGQISGTIIEIGITYVHLSTVTGVISIPNSQVLNAVVGPLPDPGTYSAPQPAPPLMATPAGQPTPAPPLMANRNRPKNRQPNGDHDGQTARRPRPTASPKSRPAPRSPAPPAPPPNRLVRPSDRPCAPRFLLLSAHGLSAETLTAQGGQTFSGEGADIRRAGDVAKWRDRRCRVETEHGAGRAVV